MSYRIETSRDFFTEAQPEFNDALQNECWQVCIVDADTDELIDTNTGYDTEAEATRAGNEWLQQHNS